MTEIGCQIFCDKIDLQYLEVVLKIILQKEIHGIISV